MEEYLLFNLHLYNKPYHIWWSWGLKSMGYHVFKCVVHCELHEECRSFLNLAILIYQWNEFWWDIFYSFDLLCQLHLALPQVWKRALAVTPPPPYSQSTVCPLSYCQMRSAAIADFVWDPCTKIFNLGVGHVGDSAYSGIGMIAESKKRLTTALIVWKSKACLCHVCFLCQGIVLRANCGAVNKQDS